MPPPISEPLVELAQRDGFPYPVPPGMRVQTLYQDAQVKPLGWLSLVEWPQTQLDGTTVLTYRTVCRPPAVVLMPTNSKGEVMLVTTTQPGAGTYEGFVAGDTEPGDPSIFYRDHSLAKYNYNFSVMG